MVVSKRWFEFGPESKFPHPISTSILQSAPAELPNFYFRAEIGEKKKKRPNIGKQDVGNFALSYTAKTPEAEIT